ncbi:MAG: hypothetical protein WC490_04910 [Candidatus Margulisiibacteriota bacterium]
MTFDAGAIITANITATTNPFLAANSAWNNAQAVINSYNEYLKVNNKNQDNDKHEDFIAFLSAQHRTAPITLTVEKGSNLDKADANTSDGKYVLEASPIVGTAQRATYFGSITLYHWEDEANAPDSKETWEVTYDSNTDTYTAQRYSEGMIERKLVGPPITGKTLEEVAGKFTALTEGKEDQYSVEIKDANGVITKKTRSGNEKESIHWTKEQKDMQRKQWKLQLYQAILEGLQSVVKLFGIKAF